MEVIPNGPQKELPECSSLVVVSSLYAMDLSRHHRLFQVDSNFMYTNNIVGELNKGSAPHIPMDRDYSNVCR